MIKIIKNYVVNFFDFIISFSCLCNLKFSIEFILAYYQNIENVKIDDW